MGNYVIYRMSHCLSGGDNRYIHRLHHRRCIRYSDNVKYERHKLVNKIARGITEYGEI